MSPLLFNAVLIELICRTEATNAGVEMGEEKYNVQAYADDLVLLSSSLNGQHLVRLTDRFLGLRNMELNRGKCTHLSVNLLPAKKTLYTTVRCQVFLVAQATPQIGPENFFIYLGLRLHPVGIVSEISGINLAH